MLNPAMYEWIGRAKAARLADAMAILRLGHLKKSGQSFAGPCPICGGRDRFWLNTMRNRWGCRGCRPKSIDAIDLVRHVEQCGFLEACERLNGCPPPDGRRTKEDDERRAWRMKELEDGRKARLAHLEHERAADMARRLGSARGIWNETVPLDGPPKQYLKSRGINPDFADDQLRSHSGLPHPAGGSFPALVARVSNPDGDGVGVWRIFVKMDGTGKAPVANPKLGLGVVAGGAVRIGGIWPHIAVAEGIESALAVRELIGGGMPCWAALSTSGLRGLVLPAEIERVDIYCDGDPPKLSKHMASPGLSAAEDLARRLKSDGRMVTIQTPPLSSDWLDCLVAAKKVEAA